MSLFLTPQEVAELTGIARGRDGFTREQMQADHLRKLGIPFFPNASGRPMIARVVIEGGTQQQKQPKQTWQPAVLSH
ncbi:MAG: DUF4224 domain-containing protein [Methylotenera sp.]